MQKSAGPGPGPSSDARNVLLEVLPLGLVIAGLLSAAYAWLASPGGASLGGGSAQGFRRVAMAERWPELLAEALIAGVVASLVLTFSSAAKPGASPSRGVATALAVLVTLVATGAYLTGFPGGLPGVGAVPLAAALGVTLMGLGLSRLPFRGVLALVFGLGVGFGLPYGLATYTKRTAPGMPVTEIVLDVVARTKADGTEFLSVVEAREDAPIATGVISPVVTYDDDTGEKPSLILVPPAAVEFDIPEDAGDCRLTGGVNMDLSSAGTMAIKTADAPAATLPVTYRVLADGVLLYEETVSHENVRLGYIGEHMQWRYISEGEVRGVPVRGGMRVRLETALPPELDPASFAASQLKVGFGDLAVVRETTRPRAVATPSSPNIVFVVVDTQRLDRLGCYGYGKPTSPRIDQFADESLLFEDAYTTSSWTWPSTASLLTSWPPDAHGVKSNAACTLDQSLVTLAEELQGHGYTTAAFVGNPIVSADKFFDQGFETFDNVRRDFRMSDVLMHKALDWLEEHAPLRFFLYVHMVDPHTPHEPDPGQAARLELGEAPPSWPGHLDGITETMRDEGTITPETTRYANDLYDASVATGDMWFGRLLDKLDALGLDDRTIVCLTSDHGEELLDRGYRGHGHNVYPELVRAPLILRGPGIRPGRRSGVVSNRHVPTTLAALVGAVLPPFGEPVHLVDDTLPDEALFETAKGEWLKSKNQQLFGLRRGARTTQWRWTDATPANVPRDDMRHFDDPGDSRATNDMVGIAEPLAREHVARILELVEDARARTPRGITGVGTAGHLQLVGMGYTGNDDKEEDTEEIKSGSPR